MIIVAPSILASDFSCLAQEVKKVTDAGAEYVHIDVMDGTFVPNITLGSPVVKALRKTSKAVFDVHLMVEHPESQIAAFAEAGADIITFHVEAAKHVHRTIQQIKEAGCRAGLALNPGTPVSLLEDILDCLDMVLVMTVNPGFGGQEFLHPMLRKVIMLHKRIHEEHLTCDIEVDGGINPQTAALARSAGANVMVAGSAIYGMPDISKAIMDIRGR